MVVGGGGKFNGSEETISAKFYIPNRYSNSTKPLGGTLAHQEFDVRSPDFTSYCTGQLLGGQ